MVESCGWVLKKYIRGTWCYLCLLLIQLPNCSLVALKIFNLVVKHFLCAFSCKNRLRSLTITWLWASVFLTLFKLVLMLSYHLKILLSSRQKSKRRVINARIKVQLLSKSHFRRKSRIKDKRSILNLTLKPKFNQLNRKCLMPNNLPRHQKKRKSQKTLAKKESEKN